MKKITIYTTNTCAYCDMVKKWLTSKQQTYEVVNLDDQPEIRQAVIEMSGAMTVPITVVEDEETGEKNITVGWNPAKIAAAIA